MASTTEQGFQTGLAFILSAESTTVDPLPSRSSVPRAKTRQEGGIFPSYPSIPSPELIHRPQQLHYTPPPAMDRETSYHPKTAGQPCMDQAPRDRRPLSASGYPGASSIKNLRPIACRRRIRLRFAPSLPAKAAPPPIKSFSAVCVWTTLPLMSLCPVGMLLFVAAVRSNGR